VTPSFLRRAAAFVTLALIASLCLTGRPAIAGAPANLGGPVPGYGQNGRVTYDLGRSSDGASKAVFDSQGRVLILVNSTRPSPPGWSVSNQGSFSQGTLSRVLANGSLDPTFGDNGTVIVHDSNDESARYSIWKFTPTSDDGAFALVTRWPLDGTDARIVRLDSSGRLVASFGADGFAPLPHGDEFSYSAPMIARPTGGLIVAGNAYRGLPKVRQPVLRGMDASGNLDLSFGNQGYVTLDPGTDYSLTPNTRQIDFRTDGKLVVGGYVNYTNRIWLLEANGAPDTTFGNAGHIDVPADSEGGDGDKQHINVHPSNAITVADHGYVRRFLSDGAPDPNFGEAGAVPTPTTPIRGTTIDGEKTLVMYELRANNEVGMRFQRFLSDGNLDLSFGEAGTRDVPYAAFATNYLVGAYVSANQQTHDVIGLTSDLADAVLIALDSTGTLMPTFGTGGLAFYDLGEAAGDQPTRAVADVSGGLWIAARSDTGVLLHLDSTGAPVPAFGDNGVRRLPRGEFIGAIAATTDGGVIVLGAESPASGVSQALVTRLRADGSLDPAFNGGAILKFGPAGQWPSGQDLAVLVDGRIVIASPNDAVVMLADGTRDISVGANGAVATGLTGAPIVRARGDGFLVAAHEPDNAVVLRSYNGDGTADLSFGDGGTASVAVNDTTPIVNVIVDDQHITIATERRVLRLLANGAVDSSFATLTYDATYDWVRDVGVESDGSVIVAAARTASRFRPTGALDATYGADGTIVPGFGVNSQYVITRVVTRGSVTHFVETVVPVSTNDTDADVGVVARDSALQGGAPVGSVQDVRVTEGDEGSRDVEVTIALDRPVDNDSTTAIGTIVSRSATSGLDARPQFVTFAASADGSSLVAHLQIIGDIVHEESETLEVQVQSPQHLVLANAVTTVTIDDDDLAGPATGVTAIGEFSPFGSAAEGGRVAAGDVYVGGGDEIVTAPGPGEIPVVKVSRLVSGQNQNLENLFPYSVDFRGGVNVAAGDVDGDGVDEIITVPASAARPIVRVFKHVNGSFQRVANFYGSPSTTRSGGTVATADTDGDGDDEIVVGQGAGAGSEVRTFSFNAGSPSLQTSFKAYGTFTGGVSVAGADIDGDGDDEVITGPGEGGTPLVRVFGASSAGPSLVTSFMAFPNWFRGGVRVAGGDLDGDPNDEVVTAAGPGAAPQLRVQDFDSGGRHVRFAFSAYAPTFRGGVFAAIGRVEGNSNPGIVTASGSGMPVLVKAYRVTF
jgi:uncharacterized delta-60 repeat protein